MSGFNFFQLNGDTHIAVLDAGLRWAAIYRKVDGSILWEAHDITDLSNIHIPDHVLRESGLVEDFPGQFTYDD